MNFMEARKYLRNQLENSALTRRLLKKEIEAIKTLAPDPMYKSMQEYLEDIEYEGEPNG